MKKLWTVLIISFVIIGIHRGKVWAWQADIGIESCTSNKNPVTSGETATITAKVCNYGPDGVAIKNPFSGPAYRGTISKMIEENIGSYSFDSGDAILHPGLKIGECRTHTAFVSFTAPGKTTVICQVDWNYAAVTDVTDSNRPNNKLTLVVTVNPKDTTSGDSGGFGTINP